MRNLGRILTALALFLSVGIIFYWLYTIPGEDKSETPEMALLASSPARSSEIVVIQAAARRNRVNSETGTDVEIYITNLSPTVVANVRFLDIQAPGFAMNPATFASPGTLKAEESRNIRIHLAPTVDHGRFWLSLRYSWSTAGAAEKASQVRLGPLEIVDEHRARKLRFLRRVASLTKDLTLPLVLAALGYWFQRQQTKRDEKSKEHQIERDAISKEQQTERDRHYQVWSSILPRFHQLSEKHYLPIVRSLRLVMDKRPTTAAALSDQATMSQYLYELLLLLRKMAYLRDDKGQIFFNDRVAERLVSLAWKVFVERVEAQFSTVKRDQALQIMKPSDSYFSFQKRFADPADITKEGQLHHDLRIQLTNWINAGLADKDGGDFGRHMSLVWIMKEAVYFEANRPFDEYWYGTKPQFKLTEALDLPDQPQDVMDELKPALKQYVKEVTEYLAAN